ncbi:MAG: ImmA/IrrE family metallo-endopeptidase [Pseudomonadota bacterium]
MISTDIAWTHPSVLAFACDRDPLQAIEHAARDLALRALDNGWVGPPFDSFALARVLGYEVSVSDEVRDAMVTQAEGHPPSIVFNPAQPRTRINFSIAHEIVHTLFPDFNEAPRYRLGHEVRPDAWQLELLCNLGAAEVLMPSESFDLPSPDQLTMDWIRERRRELRVSTEALLLRLARLVDFALAVFSASRLSEAGETPAKIRLDYLATSRALKVDRRAPKLRVSPTIEQCTAIAFTSKGEENWPPLKEEVRVECIGLPAYGGQAFPRVAGFALPIRELPRAAPFIEYVIGDATAPRGSGARVVAQIVNNRTPTWTPLGFAGAVKKKWPQAQADFHAWAASRENLALGRTHRTEVEPALYLMSMVAQAGFGPSNVPRIRYKALRECLREVGEFAKKKGASVHLPRIGTGQAGGSWPIIRDLIEEEIGWKGVRVFVYDLPTSRR